MGRHTIANLIEFRKVLASGLYDGGLSAQAVDSASLICIRLMGIELAGKVIPTRSSQLHQEQAERIRELKERGLDPPVIAQRLGVSRSTVYRAFKRIEDESEAA